MQLLCSETKTGANQSVNACFKTVKTLFFWHYLSLENEDNLLISFYRHHFSAQTQLTRLWKSGSPFADERFIIAPHCFRYKDTNCDFILKQLSKIWFKRRRQKENNTSLYILYKAHHRSLCKWLSSRTKEMYLRKWIETSQILQRAQIIVLVDGSSCRTVGRNLILRNEEQSKMIAKFASKRLFGNAAQWCY